MQSWTAGEIADADLASALGGSIDGLLSEYRLFDERGLVAIPDALSFEEAAKLRCAAVTGWNGLFGQQPITAGQAGLTFGNGERQLYACAFGTTLESGRIGKEFA